MVSVIDTGADAGMKQKSDDGEIDPPKCKYFFQLTSDLPTMLFTTADGDLTASMPSFEDSTLCPCKDATQCPNGPQMSDPDPTHPGWSVQLVFLPLNNTGPALQCVFDPGLDKVTVSAGAGRLNIYAYRLRAPDDPSPDPMCSQKGLIPFPPHESYQGIPGWMYLGTITLQTPPSPQHSQTPPPGGSTGGGPVYNGNN
jgi:hypothetical protein